MLALCHLRAFFHAARARNLFFTAQRGRLILLVFIREREFFSFMFKFNHLGVSAGEVKFYADFVY